MVYAIIESGGLQFKVQKEVRVRIPKLEGEVGAPVSFPKVLMVSDGKKSLIGRPYVDEAEVKATLVGHGKNDKVIVYKYKRRKNYRRKKGHRQDYSDVLITEILSPSLSARKSAPEKKEVKEEEKRAERKKPATAKAKEKKVAKPKAKAVKKKVTKRTTAKKVKPSKPKPKPASKAKKKPTRRVIGRLRRKTKKEK